MSNPLDVDLQGALAVVVGGNQGIGAAIAIALAEAGCRLVITARDEQRLATTKERAQAVARGVVDTHVVDVASTDSIDALAAHVFASHGTPTIVVNSAGGTIRKPILDVTPHDWDVLIDTHLRGTFFVGQAFGRAMVAAGYGKIINLSSTWASTFAPGRSVYATAKAGVGHLTTAMAVEWAPSGVCVNAIAPTSTLTPRVQQRLETDPDRSNFAVSRIPMGRLATPDDIVGTALFLASPASDFVTGQTIYVDGGWQYSK